MAGSVPKERYAEAVAWLFPLVGIQDRENLIRVWQALMPPPVFTTMVPLVRNAIGDGWAELAGRVPELGS